MAIRDDPLAAPPTTGDVADVGRQPLRRWTTGDLVGLAALLGWVASLCLLPISETDVFFRLKVGQEIVARHALLGHNLFSFTAPSYPDLDAAWGFEVALAAVHRLAGFPGIIVAKTTVIGAALAALFALCRRRGVTVSMSVVVLALTAEVMRERFVERPHIVSFGGEAVILWGAWGARRPWRPRSWVAFAAAMLLWANGHAGIFVATGVLGLAALGWSRRDRAVSRRLAMMACLSGVAAFATPIGWGILRYWELHVRIPRLHAIDEFRRATWRSDGAYVAWLGALGLGLGLDLLLAHALRRRAARGVAAQPASRDAPVGVDVPGWAELLPVAGIALLGCLSVRFAADAVLLSAPAFALAWTRVLDAAARRVGSPPARPRGPEAVTTALASAALLVLTVAPRLAQIRAGHPAIDLGLAEGLLPLDALGFVEAHGLRERMYNDFETGSYLAFEGYPRHRVFVDPRLPAYPEDFQALLGSFDLTPAEWDAAMVRYGVQSALLTYAGVNRRVAWWDPARWALVYRRNDARVFVRRLPRWAGLIAELEIPATFSFTVEDGAVTLPLEAEPPESPVRPCEWQRRLGDLWFELEADRGGPRAELAYRRALEPPGCLPSGRDEARLASWLGTIDLSAGRIDAAIAHLTRALELSSDDGLARAARARALAAAGRVREAIADWSTVAKTTTDVRLESAAITELRRLQP